MRTRLVITVAALLLVSAGAKAQDATGQTPDTPLTNQLDFGIRGTSIDGNSDRARFERYRDLRDGATLDRVRFGRETDRWLFDLQADHVGYHDQRLSGAYNRYGKVKASFEWDQTPLFYSGDTSWLYTSQGNGELRIADSAIRTLIQNGALKVQNVGGLLGSSFDLRQRRDVASLNVVASVTKEIDAKFFVNSTHKNGEMPWGASFGFSAANEVAAPIDHRTTDFGAALEWANSRGMARVGYDGSWFDNAIPTLTFDSPYRITDSTNPSAYVTGNGTSQGRTAMWPDSAANTVSAAASYNLPGRSRLNGAFSIGDWRQNAALLPYTINTAIPAIPLDRATAEADARISSFNVNFTSRPADFLWFNVRTRRYDFDNRTQLFNVTNYVRLDQVIEPSILGHNEPFGYARDFVDADASFTFLPYTALKVGYGFEKDDRTFRVLETTTEHTLRTALDTSGNPYASFRLAYEHSKRVGTGLDEEVLDEIGEQVSLRQFDISDRDRDRVTALAQITPVSQFAVVASIATGRDTRPDANFGLRRFDTNGYSIGFDATPIDAVGFGLTYGYDDAKTNQKSRQANPGAQFNDPTRDWFTDMNEKVHYLGANVDLLKALPKTDIRFAFDWNKSNADYTYVLPANTTLPPATRLPTVYNELQRARVDFRYFLTKHVAAGFVYMYESCKVDDFQMSPNYAIGNRTLPDGIMLGYFFRPYTANTGWFRLTYLW